VPHDELVARTVELAQAIAEQDREMVRVLRRDWNASSGLAVEDARRVHSAHASEVASGGSTAAALASRGDAVMARSRGQRP
jgi:fatty acid/phospholipid biosynthesis enzyme